MIPVAMSEIGGGGGSGIESFKGYVSLFGYSGARSSVTFNCNGRFAILNINGTAGSPSSAKMEYVGGGQIDSTTGTVVMRLKDDYDLGESVTVSGFSAYRMGAVFMNE